MRSLSTLLVSLACLPAFVLPSDAAVVHAPASLLLRIHDVYQYQDGGSRSEEAILFRDGLLLRVRVQEDGSRSVRRNALSAEDMRFFNDLLRDVRVGFQRDDRCGVSGFAGEQPGQPPLTARDTLISWFGRNGRSNHLPIFHADLAGAPAPGSDPLRTCADPVKTLTQEALGLILWEQEEEAPGPGPVLESGPRGESLLLEVLNEVQEDPLCGDNGFSDDTYIFRDGLLYRSFLRYDGTYLLERAHATPEAQRFLKSTLSDQRVGQQGGSCRVWFFLAFFVDGACLDFGWQSTATWFGRHDRETTILGNEQIANACTTEQSKIATALNAFIRNTLAQPATESVNGRFPR